MLRSARFWVGLLISAVFIALLFVRTDPSQVLRDLRQANYAWMIPAVGVYFLSVWVRAIRYAYIVRSVKPIRSAALFPVLVIGYMANNLLPARAGEIIRAYVLGEKHQVSKMSALGTVAVERLFDGLTLLGFLALSVLILGGDGALKGLALTAVAIFACALAVFVGALAAPDATERLIDRCTRLLPERFRSRAYDLACSFVEGLRSLRHPDSFAWVSVTSVIAWLMEAACYMLVGYAFGLELGFGYFIMAVGAGNLAITAPSSQGGIGPFEFFVSQVVIGAGIANGDASAYAIVVHAVIIVPATVLGLYYLWAMKLSLGGLRTRATAPAYERVAVDSLAND